MRKSRRQSQLQRTQARRVRRNAQLRHRRQVRRVDNDRLDWALRQWALSAHQDGEVGPEQLHRCASAEGRYVSTDLWEPPPAPLPDADENEADHVERAMRKVSHAHRAVLKMHYIRLFSVPIERTEDFVVCMGAKLLNIRPAEYEEQLHAARGALYRAMRL